MTSDHPAPRSYRQFRFEAPAGSTEIFLVRHGESRAVVVGEPVPEIDGHADPPLAPEGERQAELVGGRLAKAGISAIVTSNLTRTIQTAAPLARLTGIEPTRDSDLREVFLGAWEGGLFRIKVIERDLLALRMYAEERYDVIPGAESNTALVARARGAIERIAAAHPDRRVVVVAHGGMIGAILAAATGVNPFAFGGSDNGALSHLVVAGARWTVRSYNDRAHLDV